MKNKIFTQLFLSASLMVGAALTINAQDAGIGTGWDNMNPTSPLVLNEDFSGFTFYGNWIHTNNSNSKDVVDENTGEVTPANMSGTKTIEYLNSTKTLTYTWDSCAFAPEWGVAASVDGDGVPVDPDPTTQGVSNGFVEIARNGYGTLPGEFIVDLSNLDFIEGIQYSHSSCGGKRRGFMLSLSLDAGTTWDTIRYEPGDKYSLSFTKDPFDWSKIANDINCTPSANGMLWEEALYLSNDEETKVWLKFEACNTDGPQAVRIHDLKVYGDLGSTVDNVAEFNNSLKIKVHQDMINMSDQANVSIYSISGRLIKSANAVKAMSIGEMENGIYIIKAQSGNNIATQKFIKK